MKQIGLALIGTPYGANTLEMSDTNETCVVKLDSLDCVTFYETSLGFARMLTGGGKTQEALLKEIEFIRYRAGRRDGYLSRLHYTSDWMADNVSKGVVRDLTPQLPGAKEQNKKIDFMSTHPASYRQLKANADLVFHLQKIEAEINGRGFFYVPSDKVAGIESYLADGDIIGIVTSVPGLDCSHTGMIATDKAGVRRFLNASSIAGKVVLGERLSDYVAASKKCIGIIVARPN